jgi:hypothetical protein
MSGSIKGPVDLQPRNKKCQEEIYVAPIQDEMLLVLVLLRKYCGEIDLKADTILIDDSPIKMEVSGNGRVSRVVVARHTIVPANSVAFVPCETSFKIDQFVFESTPDHAVLLPRTVHTADSPLMVCAVDLSNRNVTSRQNQRIGEAECVAVVKRAVRKDTPRGMSADGSGVSKYPIIWSPC